MNDKITDEDKHIIDNLEQYLYNENNILITKDFIKETMSIIKKQLKKHDINYKVNDINLFITAMTHESYFINFIKNEKNWKIILQNIKNRNIQPRQLKKNWIDIQDSCYERLEFLGDSIIRLVVAEYLFERYNDKDEGFLTRLKMKIENGESLAYLSRCLGFDKYAIMAKYIELNGGRTKDDIGILGDIFESFIGALYLDSDKNLNICKLFIIHIIETRIDIASLLFHETNYKELLVKYYHQMKWADPTYETIEIREIGENKKKIFTMGIKDNNGVIVGRGEGVAKKKGEQLAAKEALSMYGQLDTDSECSEIEVDSDF